MKQRIMEEIVQQMLPYLDNVQLQKLQEVLEHSLYNCEISGKVTEAEDDSQKLIDSFVYAKRIEGCSEKTLKYYRTTIEAMTEAINKGVRHMQTDDLRAYLTEYQEKHGSSRVTIDNIRRILSSFFSWLEDEDHILKSPVRRIHKVKTATNIKETYTDEELEKMRDNCEELRDLAIVDMLASTGMRIGEMVLLNAETILHLLSDTAELEKRLDESAVKMNALVEQTENIVAENARVVLDQETYNERYDSLISQYEAEKATYDKLESEIADKKARHQQLQDFIIAVKETAQFQTEFDKGLWCALVDFLTVKSKDEIAVTFRDRTEITVK